MKTYFILRGVNEYLAYGELKALLDTYNPGAKLNCYTMICTSDVSVDIAAQIVRRAGFIREAGILLDIVDAYSIEEARNVREIIKSKEVHTTINKSTISKKAVQTFLEVAKLQRSTHRSCKNRLVFSDGLVFIGVKKAENNINFKSWSPSIKPFNRSIAIPPDIAKALVNLSRAREGDILIDPFAGTGSILIVAWLMGIRGIGVDINWDLVRGIHTNVQHLKANVIAICGDSQQLTFREVDHVATDLPYGRSASTHGTDIKVLYRSFIEKLGEYLAKGGYACFMVPHWLEEYVDELVSRYSLKLKGRYYDYAHGSLTRVINVVSW